MSASPFPSISIVVHLAILVVGRFLLFAFGPERLGHGAERVQVRVAPAEKVTFEDMFGPSFHDSNSLNS